MQMIYPQAQIQLVPDYMMQNVLCMYSGEPKAAILMPLSSLKRALCHYDYEILPTLGISDEITIAFPPNLVDLANKVIMRLRDTANLDMLQKVLALLLASESPNLPNYNFRYTGPFVLALNDLWFYFVIWYHTILIAIAVFIIEIAFGIRKMCKERKTQKRSKRAKISKRIREESFKTHDENQEELKDVNNVDESLQEIDLECQESQKNVEEKMLQENDSSVKNNQGQEEVGEFSPDDPEIPRKTLREYLDGIPQSSDDQETKVEVNCQIDEVHKHNKKSAIDQH
jgi:hypothetical protein